MNASLIADWIAGFATAPVLVRWAVLATLGAVCGAWINWAVTAHCFYFPMAISPWSPQPTDDAAGEIRRDARKTGKRSSESPGVRLSMIAYLPIIGWFFHVDRWDAYLPRWRRRRGAFGYEVTSASHPFLPLWVRPMLVEICVAVLMVLLWEFTVGRAWMIDPMLRIGGVPRALQPHLHHMFLLHAAVMVLMVAATLIDFDERTIPDWITVPGLVIALISSMVSFSGGANATHFLPTPMSDPDQALVFYPTILSVPWEWNGWYDRVGGLSLAVLLWTVWAIALGRRPSQQQLARSVMRLGLRRACSGYTARFLEHSPTWLAVLWLALLLGIVSVWSLGGTAWQGLLSGLLGMAIGGGTVWAIRLVATAALNRTAMGFGDVTLMAFLGAALGWQGALIAFFLSPFAAIIMTLVQIILFRENRIAFGPFLCAGAALTVAFWNATWVDRLGPVLFGLGLQWFLFILIGALVLMAVMLIVYRGIKIAILGRLQSE